MAAQLYLVSKAASIQAEKALINGIYAMIINADDGDNDATKLAEAVTAAVAAGDPLPTGYFDTVQLLGPPTGGIMTTDLDVIILYPRTKTEVIA